MSKIEITCFTFGHQIDVPSHFSVRTHYGFSRLCHVKKGGTLYKDEDGEIYLEEGYVYLLPLKSYTLQPTSNSNFVHTWCHFLMKGFPFNSVIKIDTKDNHVFSLYIQLIDEIVSQYSQPPKIDHDQTEHITLTSDNEYFSPLSDVTRSFLELFYLTVYDSKENGDNLERIIAYINSNLSEDLSNEVLAKLALYNKIYFIQKFTAKYNLSPQKYVLRARISEAIAMLMNDEKVDDISYKLGYENSKSFSRAFKREVGLSPQHYKIIHYYNIRS